MFRLVIALIAVVPFLAEGVAALDRARRARTSVASASSAGWSPEAGTSRWDASPEKRAERHESNALIVGGNQRSCAARSHRVLSHRALSGVDPALRILAADTDLLPHAGRQRVFSDTVRGLSARGHEIDVFIRTPGTSLHPLPEGTKRVQVPGFLERRSKGVKEGLRFAGAVLASLRGHHDLVFVNRPELSAFAVTVSKVKRIPAFCYLHDYRYGYSRKARYVLRHVTRLIAVSGFIKDAYIQRVGIDPRRIDVVYPGVDPSYYRPADADTRVAARKRFGLPHDAYVILYAGRIDVTKGIDLLIEAFTMLGPLRERSHLLIAGMPNRFPGGTEPRPEGLAYQAELKRVAPADRCHWVGYSEDVRPFYHAADVAVVPSRWDEPFSRAMLEPMACGMPVLASAVGGAPEALRPRFTEFLFARGDARELSKKLTRLSDWREEEPRLGAACRDHVQERFNVDGTVDELERLFLDGVRNL